MISLHFGIPLEQVEDAPITDYRLMLFTIFNNAALTSGMGDFRMQTDEEAADELESQIDMYKKQGFFNG